MNETNPITLLAKLKPFAQHLSEVFDLENYSLSKAEKKSIQAFFRLRASKNYSQLKLLRSQANITADEFECLEVIHTGMMLRYLEGRNMQTGKKLSIFASLIQWLELKLRWEMRLDQNKGVHHARNHS